VENPCRDRWGNESQIARIGPDFTDWDTKGTEHEELDKHNKLDGNESLIDLSITDYPLMSLLKLKPGSGWRREKLNHMNTLRTLRRRKCDKVQREVDN